MQCSICSRSHTPKLPFRCPACARQDLYDLRIQNAKALLSRESASHTVEDVVCNTGRQGTKEAAAVPHRKWELQRISLEMRNSGIRRKEVQARSEVLRKEIEKARAEISKQKAKLDRRQADFSSATHNLVARRASSLDSVQKSIKRTVHRSELQHQRTAQSRVFLCREAANLLTLRQRRRKKGNVIRDEYTVGGVGIVDLKHLNNASPVQITTSLTNTSHLLVLTSHYLGLQLPAEITLPHRNYPLPTIFPPASSYTSRKVPFPGSTPSQSSNNSPSSSRTGDLRPLPRPRPLFIDKPLPQLAREDSAAYSLFVEGVTLLAWDVAWVCRTQGINVGARSWDEVCSIGKNLWQLFVATPTGGLLPQVNSRTSRRRGDVNPVQTAPARNSPGPSAPQSPPPPITRDPSTPPLQTLGHYSHGSAYAFLGGADGNEFMRGWKLERPMKIVDQVKSLLQGEMTGAEWEMLTEREWDEEAEAEAEKGGGCDDEAVLVDKTRIADATRAERTGKLTDGRALSDQGEPSGDTAGNDRAKEKSGTSGWTKVRPRP